MSTRPETSSRWLLIGSGVLAALIIAGVAVYIGSRWTIFFADWSQTASVYVASRTGGADMPVWQTLIWQTPLALLMIWAILNSFTPALSRVPKNYPSITFAATLLAFAVCIGAGATLLASGLVLWNTLAVTIPVAVLAFVLLVWRVRVARA